MAACFVRDLGHFSVLMWTFGSQIHALNRLTLPFHGQLVSCCLNLVVQPQNLETTEA